MNNMDPKEPSKLSQTDDFLSTADKRTTENASSPDVPQRKRRKAEFVKPDPTPGRCQFFVERKRRYCKAPPRKEKIYCVEHSYELEVS